MNNEQITLTFPNGKIITCPIYSMANDYIDYFSRPVDKKIVAVYVNNEIYPLNKAIPINANLRPVFLDTAPGAAIYRRTLCFVLATACHKIAPQKHLVVGHSLGYGYYYTIEGTCDVANDFLIELENTMKQIITEDKALKTVKLSWEEAALCFEKLGLNATRAQLDFMCPSVVIVNKLDDFCDLWCGALLAHTGLLSVFELRKYNDGFLLRFPTAKQPDSLVEFHDSPKLFEVYKMYKSWGRALKVTNVASLNNVIAHNKQKEFINITETFQEKQISNIATSISKRPNAKVVLIAGPSSSGKTTTSMKLSLQLQAIGYSPKLISLDNYYVGRESNPKDENGNYDYECLEALDIELLNNNLVDLFAGKTIEIPSYNFTAGKRYYDNKTLCLHDHDILIMEGIHGLNDKLTPLISRDKKFKIYISALTQLNIDDHNRISTSDNRLLRRIVRDSNFRGKSASATIGMWENVTKGERLHIFPFQNNADAMLNTALDYELSVLKVYVEPLLQSVTPKENEYAEATRLLSFINAFYPIPETAVPKLSIIREFIGGSDFRY